MNVARKSLVALTLCGLVGLLAVSGPPLALGDSADYEDPDDTISPLDISTYGHGHIKSISGPVLVHRLTTYEAWESDIIDARTSIRFYFDTDLARGFERMIEVRANPDGTLYGELLSVAGRNQTVGFTRAWRTDDRSLSVAFPLSMLMKRKHPYEWAVIADYYDPSGDCTCRDHVDNVLHELGKN